MVAAPDVGWMASSAVLLLMVAGCQLCFVFTFSRAVLLPSLLPVGFFLFFFLLIFHASFIFFPITLVCWLAWFLPVRSLRLALHDKSPCRIYNFELGLVACDHRARLSRRRRHRHSHCAGCRWVEYSIYCENTRSRLLYSKRKQCLRMTTKLKLTLPRTSHHRGLGWFDRHRRKKNGCDVVIIFPAATDLYVSAVLPKQAYGTIAVCTVDASTTRML